MDKIKSFELRSGKEQGKDNASTESYGEKEKNPEVRFGVSKEIDIFYSARFIKRALNDISSTRGIFDLHPELEGKIRKANRMKKDVDGQENVTRVIQEYFEEFYRKHETELVQKSSEFQDSWDAVSNKFFIAAKSAFNGYSLPEKSYNAYLSIIRRGPRDLENKRFQVFYGHSKPVYAISHEMLHYLFFGYIETNYAKFAEMSKERDSVLWRMSEIHDSVVLADPEFAELTGVNNVVCGYSHLEKYLEPLGNYWKKTKDIDKWIEYAYQFISKDNLKNN